MSTHKYIDKICLAAVIAALLITVLFMNGRNLGITVVSASAGYESRLFDAGTVHTIDIVMDDWESFIETCEDEEYVPCSVVIDGEAYKNIGIRAKGNTSLSTVSQMNSERYSFKLEFDQYDNTKSYYGLDKLSLNNIIQDNTYMKDFLTYQMMGKFGVDAPLCSYVYITVNGEDWGLYLAVEGVEDAFLERNYGKNHGELYKPDSMSFGGGRGNGRDFDMEEFDMQNFPAEDFRMPEMTGGAENLTPPEQDGFTDMSMDMSMDMGSMGSSDVKLQYIDDDPSSYSNIFDNAKTDITEADKQRLIESLKSLSNGENIEEVVNIEEVIRYFVVHNFVVNGDSYTGSMIHNYYLYEEDGKLSMIPWDYNLAFGTFQSSDATSTVNDPIDSPVSGGSMEDRPMIAWIFDNEEYTELYHAYFTEFLTEIFDSGEFTELVDNTKELIAPYMEKDPTKFCTYEEFETGVETIREFCLLRAESIKGQLDGTIPSTQEGQSADSKALIDASSITISDMGTMNMGGGGNIPDIGGDFGGGNIPDVGGDFGGGNIPDAAPSSEFPMPGAGGLSPREDGENRDIPAMADNIEPGDMKPQNMENEERVFPMENRQDNAGTGPIVLLIISCVVLAAGLVVAYKFKK